MNIRLKPWFRVTLIVLAILAAEVALVLVCKLAWILQGIDY